MRLARIDTGDGIVTGEYEDGTVETEERTFTVGEDATLLAPADPSAIYCAGRNYADYVGASDSDRPDYLHWFLKPPAALEDPGRTVPYPSFTEELGCAGELAAVIGERCKNVSPAEAEDVVRGFTIMNDLDAEDQPETTSRKVFDSAAPLGPWIETDLDPTDLDMRTTINGVVGQEANTAQMFWGPWEIISKLSERVTFEPGDVIAYGSPGSPDPLEPGDEMEIWYEGIGVLRNTIGETTGNR